LQRESGPVRELSTIELHPAIITHTDQWVLHGSSAIIGPDGGYVEAPVYDEDRVIVAEVDLDRMREESMTLDVTTTTLGPELFKLRPLHSGRRGLERD